jgi:hypothetical protein
LCSTEKFVRYIENYVRFHLKRLPKKLKENTFTPDIKHRFDVLNDYITSWLDTQLPDSGQSMHKVETDSGSLVPKARMPAMLHMRALLGHMQELSVS